MSYGIIKIDTVTFTDNSVDKTVSLSGLIQNPTFTGNVTATGTISGDVLRGGTTISGATVTGTTANFASGVFTTQVSGITVIATTGTFTSLTGTTTTGTTANFASGVFTTALTKGEARFSEATANGTNYVGFQAPASIAADVLWTLPATAGTAAQVLSTDGAGTLSWASATSISVGNTSATVTDTGADGKFTVVTEGNTALTISAQATLFGAGFTTALNYYSVSSSTEQSSMSSNYIAGGGGNNPAGPLLWSYGNSTAASACELTFLRTKSNVSTDLTGQTTANDALGYVNFIGTDGTNTRPCASIQAYSEIAILSASSPGRLVFGTTTSGTTVISEKLRITNGGTIAYNQPTPTSKSAAATLTVAELQTGIIEYTGAAATLTLPTGTLTEGGFAGIYTNMAFQWSVINTGTGICTIGASTAHTIVGGATVAIGTSAQFASRRTAANTFVSYRLS
jgi:hypothetical protein